MKRNILIVISLWVSLSCSMEQNFRGSDSAGSPDQALSEPRSDLSILEHLARQRVRLFKLAGIAEFRQQKRNRSEEVADVEGRVVEEPVAKRRAVESSVNGSVESHESLADAPEALENPDGEGEVLVDAAPSIECLYTGCTMRFKSKRACRCHMRKIHGFRVEPKYSFDFKPKGMPSQSVVSSEPKPKVACPQCGVEFTRRDNMVVHLRDQHGYKFEHECPYGCGMTSASLGLMRVHQRVCLKNPEVLKHNGIK